MYCKAKKNFVVFWKFLKIFSFENLLHKKHLKGGISIYADFGPPRYVLWCCSGICHEVLTFIQIGCETRGPTVVIFKCFWNLFFFNKCAWNWMPNLKSSIGRRYVHIPVIVPMQKDNMFRQKWNVRDCCRSCWKSLKC